MNKTVQAIIYGVVPTLIAFWLLLLLGVNPILSGAILGILCAIIMAEFLFPRKKDKQDGDE